MPLLGMCPTDSDITLKSNLLTLRSNPSPYYTRSISEEHTYIPNKKKDRYDLSVSFALVGTIPTLGPQGLFFNPKDTVDNLSKANVAPDGTELQEEEADINRKSLERKTRFRITFILGNALCLVKSNLIQPACVGCLVKSNYSQTRGKVGKRPTRLIYSST